MSEKNKQKCFGNPLTKQECNNCPDAIECIMTLYDRPLPSLILYGPNCFDREPFYKEAEKCVSKKILGEKMKRKVWCPTRAMMVEVKAKIEWESLPKLTVIKCELEKDCKHSGRGECRVGVVLTGRW